MTDLIRALALWARRRFHRVGRAPAMVAPRRAELEQPPAARSPYGLDAPLNGHETAMVRPYLVAHEHRQWRLAAVLAAEFAVDPDTRIVRTRATA